jgi:hypothetical protein
VRQESLLEIKPEALDRIELGQVGGSGTRVILSGTFSAFAPCQPAWSTTIATCSLAAIVLANSSRYCKSASSPSILPASPHSINAELFNTIELFKSLELFEVERSNC